MTNKFLAVIFVFFAVIFQACSGGGSDNDSSSTKAKKKTTDSTVRVNLPLDKYDYAVYLENSGSLNGYLNVSGDGSFKDVVYSLISDIYLFPEKKGLSLNDINSRIIPVALKADAEAISRYISNLDAITFRKRSIGKGGNQDESDLSKVFAQVLDSTKANTVSVLISDCIFSPEKGKDATNYLSAQRSTIKAYFYDKRSKTEDLATLILQFNSDFKGNYYYQDNTYKDAFFKSRPYYITCIGPEDALRGIYNHVEAKFSSKVFTNFLFLTAKSDFDVNPTIEIFNVCYDYDLDQPLQIKHCQKSEIDKRFLIKVDVDFSELPVGNAYLRDSSRYSCTPPYKVDRVVPITGNKNYTHEVVISAPAPKLGSLNISLENKLPNWINTTNLESDKGLSPAQLENKTFGIKYLLGGIYDAYYASPRYFSFTINVQE